MVETLIEQQQNLRSLFIFPGWRGNIIVELDVDDYEKGIEELQFSIIGRLSIQRSEAVPTTLALRRKLDKVLKIQDYKIIPYGRGIYHILLHLMEDQAMVMSRGLVHLHPGIIGFTRWYPGFTPQNHKQTMTRVWIRLLELPLEYRKE